MMTQAFYTGISGLKANQTAIDVISDNLSNTSTVGYRGYSSEFSSMFEAMLNTDSVSSSVDSSIGVGAKLNNVVMNEQQGVLMLSDKSTDLAILGDGWFGIQGAEKPMYTRDGSFTFDANRDLVTNDGYYVLGTMGNNINGEVLTEQLSETQLGDIAAQEKLRFPNTLSYPAEPTTQASFYGNLNLREDETTVSMSAEVIDGVTSDGVTQYGVNIPHNNRNNLRLEFTKADPQVLPGVQWDVTATVKSLDGVITYATESGVVNFDERGALISTTLSAIDNNGTPVNINLGTDFNGVKSANAPFSSSSSSNGFVSGDLLGYDINKNGEVIATFTNGMQSSVGKVAVFHFQNDRGLERVNGSRFTESNNSGKAIFFQDEKGRNIIGADMTNFKLEGSNVRTEVGLTDIIIMQRAFDANSKCVSTADEMLQKALSMHK